VYNVALAKSANASTLFTATAKSLPTSAPLSTASATVRYNTSRGPMPGLTLLTASAARSGSGEEAAKSSALSMITAHDYA